LFSRGTEFSVADDGQARLKAAGLIPFKYVELSVYRTVSLSESLIWKMGDVFVAALRKRPVVARAKFPASLITSRGLQVRPQEPPPRHADLLPWPTEKHAQLSIAQQIIESGATIELRPKEGTR
jgi:hypothetical protein